MNCTMTSAPLVTIVMCTYDGERFLAEQLHSIVNQTYKNLEIIIQDDGSTDKTLEIIRSFAIQDRRINYRKNEKNLGIIENFYDAISRSKGEFIAISDQDDIWKLNKIETLLLQLGGADLIYTDSVLIDENSNSTGKTLLDTLEHNPKDGKFLISLFQENTISGHSCLFRATLVNYIIQNRYKKYHKNFMYDQLIGVIASFNGGVRYHKTPLTLHRSHSNNNHNKIGIDNIEDNIEPRAQTQREKRFIQRKINRVALKIKNARKELNNVEDFFSQFSPEKTNPFKKAPNATRHFSNCMFNKHLYKELRNSGLNADDARKLSRGQLHYIFFGFF